MNRPSVCRLMFLPSLSLLCALALLPSLFLVYSFRQGKTSPSLINVAVVTRKAVPVDVAFQAGPDGLRPRHRFASYDEYLQLQLNKTLNAKLRKVWSTTDWRRKINVFAPIFRDLSDRGLVQRRHKVMCIGARMGQEVVAFKEIGVKDAVGIDLVPAPPLVIRGDIHRHPFADNTFDFEFSNVFDHALFPRRFVSEIERTLKPYGVAVLHVALHTKSDKFSVNELRSVDALVSLFRHSDVVHIQSVDAFGLDTEVAMRKHGHHHNSTQISTCATPRASSPLIARAEPLILTEPRKPWLALKKNMQSVRYLPTLTDIGHHRRYIYVDIGARNYGSSIGSWFQRTYPKQGHEFEIYAIEADSMFGESYVNHSEVTFLPFAAWIQNESLLFGAQLGNNETRRDRSASHVDMGRSLLSRLSKRDEKVFQEFGRSATGGHKRDSAGRVGMGRIVGSLGSGPAKGGGLFEVQGLDIAEWVRSVAGEEDFVVVKMDVEGAEWELLSRLVETGVICLVDELFLECHYNRWQRCCLERTMKYNRTYQDCLELFQSLRRDGVLVHQWW